jgi:FkbM family methyltransferase
MFNLIRRRFHPLYRLRKLGWYRKIQSLIDPDIAIRIYGSKVYVKLLRDLSMILSPLGKEQESLGMVATLFGTTQFNVFIDVGANVGTYSWLAKKYKVENIFMFEPDSINCRLLLRSLCANQFQNVFLFPLAASALAGVESFYEDRASGATGSLALNPHSFCVDYGGEHPIAVPTLPLDTYVDFCRHKKLMIKIDVEGAETSVFAGAMRLIQEVQPLIFVECFDSSRLDVLKPLGYSFHPLDTNGNFLLTPPGFSMP